MWTMIVLVTVSVDSTIHATSIPARDLDAEDLELQTLDAQKDLNARPVASMFLTLPESA
jgi:hypothetical protein